jgi:hypothetical protein
MTFIRFTYRKDVDTVQECFTNGCNITSQEFAHLSKSECTYLKNVFYQWIQECVALHTSTHTYDEWCEYFITVRFPGSKKVLEYKGILYVTTHVNMKKN